jgi:hypothetical protein
VCKLRDPTEKPHLEKSAREHPDLRRVQPHLCSASHDAQVELKTKPVETKPVTQGDAGRGGRCTLTPTCHKFDC